jgi:hypothetical protein
MRLRASTLAFRLLLPRMLTDQQDCDLVMRSKQIFRWLVQQVPGTKPIPPLLH